MAFARLQRQSQNDREARHSAHHTHEGPSFTQVPPSLFSSPYVDYFQDQQGVVEAFVAVFG